MVHQFLISQVIDGARYCGQLCARDWDHATQLATAMGASVDGKLEAVQCARCGNVLTTPQIDDDLGFFDRVTEIEG